MVKRYGVLFTCLTSRALHIEVSHTLDTNSCINAIRRFMCRRGQVTLVRSDNGTNLVGAERELRAAIQEMDQNKIQNTVTKGNTVSFQSTCWTSLWRCLGKASKVSEDSKICAS